MVLSVLLYMLLQDLARGELFFSQDHYDIILPRDWPAGTLVKPRLFSVPESKGQGHSCFLEAPGSGIDIKGKISLSTDPFFLRLDKKLHDAAFPLTVSVRCVDASAATLAPESASTSLTLHIEDKIFRDSCCSSLPDVIRVPETLGAIDLHRLLMPIDTKCRYTVTTIPGNGFTLLRPGWLSPKKPSYLLFMAGLKWDVLVHCSTVSGLATKPQQKTVRIHMVDINNQGPIIPDTDGRRQGVYNLHVTPGQTEITFGLTVIDGDKTIEPLYNVTIHNDTKGLFRVGRIMVTRNTTAVGFAIQADISSVHTLVPALVPYEFTVRFEDIAGVTCPQAQEPCDQAEYLVRLAPRRQSRELTHGDEASGYTIMHEFPVRVDRNAAKYAQVFFTKNALDLSKPKDLVFSLRQEESVPKIFNITEKEGILYLTERPPKDVRQFTQYAEVKNLNESVKYEVTIFGIDKLKKMGGWEKCNRSCASFTEFNTCTTSCGLGSLRAWCAWAPQKMCSHYPVRCPNKECDELEQQIPSLCPQDCQDINVSTLITAMASHLNPVYTAEQGDSSRCNTTCKVLLSSISLVVVGACAAALFRLRRVRCRNNHTAHVVRPAAMMALPSEYQEVQAWQAPLETLLGRTGLLNSADVDSLISEKLMIPRKNIIIYEPIGEGAFGKVVRADAYNINGYQGYTQVAIKMLKHFGSGQELRDLLSEFLLLREVNHPNVIRLLGACDNAGDLTSGPFYVILEYCEHGNLKRYLQTCRPGHQVEPSDDKSAPPSVTYGDLLSFARQIASGMQHLAACKLVHRDLAARNILVATGRVLKISDFGLARDIYENNYQKKSRGRVPVKWMAPESLFDNVYTCRSDIWSYGVVLWEIVTLGANPYPGTPPERLLQLIQTGYRMERPRQCPEDLYSVMLKCWRERPTERPAFWEIVKKIEGMLKQEVVYLDLYPTQLPCTPILNCDGKQTEPESTVAETYDRTESAAPVTSQDGTGDLSNHLTSADDIPSDQLLPKPAVYM